MEGITHSHLLRPLTCEESTESESANFLHTVATAMPKARGIGKVSAVLVVALLLGLAASFDNARTSHHWIPVCPSRNCFLSDQDNTAPLPPVVFWAWEKPEDLRFLNPNSAAVAFLAKTIYLSPPDPASPLKSAGGFLVQPRLQPLRVAPETALIAVVRIETSSGLPGAAHTTRPVAPNYSTSQLEDISSQIVELHSFPAVRAVQIDFDATTRERGFYSALLSDVRRKLPDKVPLSITALASWCIGDPWLERLPRGTIQEAVPMLFRMGPDAVNVAKFLRSANSFPVAACRGSMGVSTDETFSQKLLNWNLPGMSSTWHQKRIYVFSPRAWTPSAAQAVLKEWQP